MGIKNLFGDLLGAARPVGLQEKNLSLDAYVILHKECCGCATEIVIDIPTDRLFQ
ncbi:uncharacterized protein LOC144363546 [Saccoglossus kowalevskii]